MPNNIIKGFWEATDFQNAAFFVIGEFQEVQIEGETVLLEADGDHPASALVGCHNDIPHELATKFGLTVEEV